jgi:uncharacterized membrane protein YfcA
MVQMPALSPLVGPSVAAAIAVMFEVMASIQSVPGAFRQANWRAILPMAAAASIGIPVGTVFLVSIDPVIVQRTIAIAILLSVLIIASGFRYTGQPNRATSLGTGLVSGFLTGIGGIGGPPVVIYFFSGSEKASINRASLIAYFGLTQAITVVTYWLRDLLSVGVVWLGLSLIPLFYVGLLLGSWLFARVNERLFRRLILGFLALVAVMGLVI